jgi:large subunit ribosomal protein L24
MKMKLKTGDSVKVISGSSKGQTGKILKVFPKLNSVVVEGVNLVKRHSKPGPGNPNGGIQEKNLPINASKVAFLTKSGKTSRLGFKINKDGSKVRIAKQDGGKEV